MKLDSPAIAERRQTPRFPFKQDIDLVLDNGDIFTVRSQNISSQGLQLVCDSWVTAEIEPRGIQNYAINHIRFKVIIDLPFESKNNENNKLYAICRIMSVQRISQEEYMLNLAFIEFENGTDKVLDDYLSRYQQKKTVIDTPIVDSSVG